ncbi:MAG: hypothetical protein MJZ76_00175 [Bacteroidales bacterium]|nr:hypothetical protein [Bacteroidales bacterium]
MSFTAPEKRIVSTWSLQKLYRNDIQVNTSDWPALKLGTYYVFHAYGPLVVTTYYNGEMRESHTGTWQFTDNKKKLNIEFFLVDYKYQYTADVKKLSKTEFVFEYDDVDGVHWRLQLYAQAD